MIRSVLSEYRELTWTLVSFLLFGLSYAGILWHTTRRSQRGHFHRAAQLPLED